MRLFLAIELSPEVQKSIHEQISSLQTDYPQFTWIPKQNYHVTIEHFGEVAYPEALKRSIDDLLYDQEEFYMYAQSVDILMSTKITIHLDFMRQKELEALVDKIRDKFVDSKEIRKKFVPHVSVARYKIPSKQQYLLLKKKIERLPIELEFPVRELVLFESILSNRFPEYKKIATIPLITKKNHSAE